MDGGKFDMKPVVDALEDLDGCFAMDAFARDKVPFPERLKLLSDAQSDLKDFGIGVEVSDQHAAVFMGNSGIWGNRMYEITKDATGVNSQCKVYRQSHE